MPALPFFQSPAATDSRTLESRQAAATAPEAKIIDSALPLADALIQRSASSDQLLPRQQSGVVLAIPTVYQGINAGPAPGVVVGIVLGSIAGFLFVLWVLWAVSNGGSFIRTTSDQEEVVVRHRSRSPARSRHARSQRTEMASRSSPRRDRVYRTERITRDLPPERSPVRDVSRVRETIIVEESRPERRVEGDDIIEVMEEHSDLEPPRRNRRRSSGYRSRY